MKLSSEHAIAILKKRNVDIRRLAGDPAAYEKAVKIVHKSIPIPLRWIVGKRRIRRVVNAVRDAAGGGPT